MLTSNGRRLRRVAAAQRRSRASWAVPLAVFLLVSVLADTLLGEAVGLVIGIALFLLVMRSPGKSFLVLIAILPFQLVILPVAFRFGVPGAIVRPAASYRDLIVLGIAAAGLRNAVRERHRLDAFDKLGLAYLAIVTLYLAVPTLLVRGPSVDFPGPPLDVNVRLLAYRVDVGFVVLALGMRHAPIAPEIRDRVLRVVVVVGAIVAAVALFEFTASSSWNNFAVNTIQLPRYEQQILNTTRQDPTDIRQYVVVAGNKLTRPGSTLFNPLEAGFYLVISLGAGLELIARNKARASVLATIVIALGLLATYVRTAVIGAIVLGFYSVRAGPGRSSAARTRMTILLIAGLVFLIPAVASTGVGSRTSSAGQDQSSTEHLDSLNAGLHALATDPMGKGLGTQPGVGDRFHTATKLTSEDAYLQVGNELGIPEMIVFVALIIALLVRLRRARNSQPDDPLTSAAEAIGVALVIGGFFLHVWTYFSVALTFWGIAGLVIGVAERSATPAPRDAPAIAAV